MLSLQKVAVTDDSGLTERYLQKGVPTIRFLNVKQLCAETGIPYDPVTVPQVGTSGVYYSRRYVRPAIAASLLQAVVATVAIEGGARRKVSH